MSLTFTKEDCKTPEKLERLFQLVRTALGNLEAGVTTATIASQKPTDIQSLAAQLAPLIRNQLQSPGATPLNLQSLLPTSSSGNTTITEDTHSNRLLAPYTPPTTLGQIFYETDRTVIYVTINSSGTLLWHYAGGTYLAAFASRPADLGTNDAGFLFYATDQTTLYVWSGSAWTTITFETAALTSNNFLFGGGGALVKDAGFSIVPVANGGTASSTAAGARTSLGAAAAGAPGAHTITLAKITGGGTNGSITWNADGVVTAYVDPT